jgi:ATPase subunit of ABC transporter with duplicated ATPase domains
MISVSDVTMRYGAKLLFEEVSTQFIPGRRFGLTGPNGAGKSTFMKILSGELEPQKGTVVRPKKLGVLRQDQYAFASSTPSSWATKACGRLWKSATRSTKSQS